MISKKKKTLRKNYDTSYDQNQISVKSFILIFFFFFYKIITSVCKNIKFKPFNSPFPLPPLEFYSQS